jgi:hypothetical protein
MSAPLWQDSFHWHHKHVLSAASGQETKGRQYKSRVPNPDIRPPPNLNPNYNHSKLSPHQATSPHSF